MFTKLINKIKSWFIRKPEGVKPHYVLQVQNSTSGHVERKGR